MKTSSRILPAALLAATVALPGPAFGFDTTRAHRVFLFNGEDEVPVGTLRCTLDELVPGNGDLGLDNADACSYFCIWVNESSVRSSANLHIGELITPGRADCEENSEGHFSTVIALSSAPGVVNRGFDKFNMKQLVVGLLMGEDGASGSTDGVVVFGGGAMVPYGIRTEVVTRR